MKAKIITVALSLFIIGCSAIFSTAGRTFANGIGAVFSRNDDLIYLTRAFAEEKKGIPVSLEELRKFAEKSDTLRKNYSRVVTNYRALAFKNYDRDSLLIEFVSYPFRGDSIDVTDFKGRLLFIANSKIVRMSVISATFVSNADGRSIVYPESGEVSTVMFGEVSITMKDDTTSTH